MDIIDIMLARAMTPQGQTETYVSIANAAAAKAEKAKDDAEEAIATIEAAASTISETQEAAETLLASAQEALETAQAAQINTLDTEDVDDEIKKMSFNLSGVSTVNDYTQTLTTTMPDGTTKPVTGIAKLYKTDGNNEDGSMTQKAIKTYITSAISNIPGGSGGGVSNLGSENEGRIVIVGSTGDIIAGTVSEEDIIAALINNGGYSARGAVGLEIDFDNKSFTRTQQAYGKTMGSDFNSYTMYGGRRRCNVADDGTINAFYGDDNYAEDGSNGQVMVYQPKFYYQRVPLQTEGNKIGKIINKDSIIVSAEAQNGFKLHPLFINENNEEVDYVLLSAYEGAVYSAANNSTSNRVTKDVNFNNDKLVSVANVKPITGSSSLTLQRAEQLANNRGTGWHIFNLQAESANQMLELIEFGTLNGQAALGKGVTLVVSTGDYNCSALTGATSTLGNESGAAPLTYIEINNNVMQYSIDGKNSISYRGIENPWGNVWTMLGGVIIYGNSTYNGGIPHICNDYNYAYTSLTNNYESVGFSLPNSGGWVSNFGYGSKDYDWLLMPAAVGGNANSALPVGDNGWFDSNLSGLRMVAVGGGWSSEDSDGPFYYACDHIPTDSMYRSYGARLMYVPTKNAIYDNNITKWQAQMNKGG